MKRAPIALAYSGSVASSAAVALLLEQYGDEVVTVTVDVGQTEDLDQVRSRALACGARRAHVVDMREAFARDYLIPALRGADWADLARLADPLIARTLAEVAAIEGLDRVAHAVTGSARPEAPCAAAFETWVHAVNPSLRVLAPINDSGLDAAQLLEYAQVRNLPGTLTRAEPHLLTRRAMDPAHAPAAEAHVEIAFEGDLPVALNDVPMTLPELIESLSLIGGQYGLGFRRGEGPAAIMLRAAYRAADGPDGVVRLTLGRDDYRIEKGSPVGAGSGLSL